GADHHRVEALPQPDQHRRVGVGADLAGAAFDRGAAIERRGEVQGDAGTAGGRVVPGAVAVELVADRGGAGVGDETPHPAQTKEPSGRAEAGAARRTETSGSGRVVVPAD